MADDATDVQSEITLDDFNADEQVAAKTDPSPVKEEKPKAEPPKEPVAAKEIKEEKTDEVTPPDVPTKDTDADEAKPPEAEVPEDKPQGEEKPLAPKSENRFQRLANENRELREQVEKLTSEVYAPQTADELTDIVNPETGENYTRAEARVVALEQKLEMQSYNERVTSAQSALSMEAFEVLQEYPIFNEDNDQYDKDLSEIARETMEANLIRDPNIAEIGPDGKPTGKGLIIDYRLSPKQIYSNLARASGISATKGQIKGQQDTEKQLANVDANSNAAPPKEKVDPLMALWKED